MLREEMSQVVASGSKSLLRGRGLRGWAVRRAGRAVLRASGLTRRASALAGAVVASLAAIYPAYGGSRSGGGGDATGNSNVAVTGVARGKATFSTVGNTTTITAANRTVINYSRFDIDPGQTVRFVQPGAGARVLNRIDSRNPSRLDGRLEANGTVYFVNRAGVIFGPNSVLDVGRLVAAAGDITDNDFALGVDRFTLTGVVSNAGRIDAAGDVALLGARVSNAGVVASQGGAVTFAAGDGVYLGTRFGNVIVKVEQRAALTGGATAVENTGEVTAGKGGITVAAGDFYSAAFRNTGRLSARTVKIAGGKGGSVSISGAVDARSETGKGGAIEVTGRHIDVVSATIDASGTTGGGTVLVGGGVMGGGGLPHATTVSVSADSVLRADATVRGDGGTVVAWSDGLTLAYGTFSAVGAGRGGDGGLVETSSRTRVVFGDAVPTARAGVGGDAGDWLVDPFNVIFTNGASGSLGTPSADDTVIGIDLVKAALEGGTNLTVTTSNGSGSQQGTITLPQGVDLNVSLSSPVKLTLHAASSVVLAGDITASGTVGATGTPAGLNLDVTSRGTDGGVEQPGARGNASVVFSGSVATNSGTIRVKAQGDYGTPAPATASVTGTVVTGGGAFTLQVEGPVTLSGDIDLGTGVLGLWTVGASQTGGRVKAGGVGIVQNTTAPGVSGPLAFDLRRSGNEVGSVAAYMLFADAGSSVSVNSATAMRVSSVLAPFYETDIPVEGVQVTSGAFGVEEYSVRLSAPTLTNDMSVFAEGAVLFSATGSVNFLADVSAGAVLVRAPVVTQTATLTGITTARLAVRSDDLTATTVDLSSPANRIGTLAADLFTLVPTASSVTVRSATTMDVGSVTVGPVGEQTVVEGVTINRPLGAGVANAVDLRSTLLLSVSSPIVVLNSGNVRLEGSAVQLNAGGEIDLPGSALATRTLNARGNALFLGDAAITARGVGLVVPGEGGPVTVNNSGNAIGTVAADLSFNYAVNAALNVASNEPLTVGNVSFDGATLSGIRIVNGGGLSNNTPRLFLHAPSLNIASNVTLGESGRTFLSAHTSVTFSSTVNLATSPLEITANAVFQPGGSLTAERIILLQPSTGTRGSYVLDRPGNSFSDLTGSVTTSPTGQVKLVTTGNLSVIGDARITAGTLDLTSGGGMSISTGAVLNADRQTYLSGTDAPGAVVFPIAFSTRGFGADDNVDFFSLSQPANVVGVALPTFANGPVTQISLTSRSGNVQASGSRFTGSDLTISATGQVSLGNVLVAEEPGLSLAKLSVTAGGAVLVGSSGNSGPTVLSTASSSIDITGSGVTVRKALDAGTSGTMRVRAGSGGVVVETGNTLTAGTLGIDSSGGVNLGIDDHRVNTLAIRSATAGVSGDFVPASGTTVTVDSVSGGALGTTTLTGVTGPGSLGLNFLGTSNVLAAPVTSTTDLNFIGFANALTVTSSGSVSGANVVITSQTGSVQLGGDVSTAGTLVLRTLGVNQTAGSVSASDVVLSTSGIGAFGTWSLGSATNSINNLAASVQASGPVLVRDTGDLTLTSVSFGGSSGDGINVTSQAGVAAPSLSVVTTGTLTLARPVLHAGTGATTDAVTQLEAATVTFNSNVVTDTLGVRAHHVRGVGTVNVNALGFMPAAANNWLMESVGSLTLNTFAAGGSVVPGLSTGIHATNLAVGGTLVGDVSVFGTMISGVTVGGDPASSANAFSLRSASIRVASPMSVTGNASLLITATGAIDLGADVSAARLILFSSGGISQSAGRISAQQLIVANTTGTASLPSAANRVGTVAGGLPNFLLNTASDSSLTVGTVGGFTGLSTSSPTAGDFTLTSGSISVSSPVSIVNPSPTPAGRITLSAVTSVAIGSSLTADQIAISASGGGVTFTADVTAGTWLDVSATGEVSQSSGIVSAPSLALRNSSDQHNLINGSTSNVIGTVAASVGGNFAVQSSTPLTVGTVTTTSTVALTGITASAVPASADFSVLRAPSITVSTPISMTPAAGGATARLTLGSTGNVAINAAVSASALGISSGSVTQSDAGAVLAPALVVRSASGTTGSFSLTSASNSFTSFAAGVSVGATGKLSVRSSQLSSVGSITHPSVGTVSGISVNSTSPGVSLEVATGTGLTASAPVTVTAGTANFDVNGALTVDNAAVSAGTVGVRARGLRQSGVSGTFTASNLAVFMPVGATAATFSLPSGDNAIGTFAADVLTTPGNPLVVNTSGDLTVGSITLPDFFGESITVGGVKVRGADGGLGFSTSGANLVVNAPIDLRSNAPEAAQADLALLRTGAITLNADVFARNLMLSATSLTQTGGGLNIDGLLITGTTTGSFDFGGANTFSKLAADVTVGSTGRLWVNTINALSLTNVTVGSVTVSGVTVAGGGASSTSLRVSGSGQLRVAAPVVVRNGRAELVRAGSLLLDAGVSAPAGVALEGTEAGGTGLINTDLLLLVANGPGHFEVSGTFNRLAVLGLAGNSFDVASSLPVEISGGFMVQNAGTGINVGGVSVAADPSTSVPSFALAAPSITITSPVSASSGSVLLMTQPEQTVPGSVVGGSITVNASLITRKLAMLAVEVTQPTGPIQAQDLYLRGFDFAGVPNNFDLSAPFDLFARPGASAASPTNGFNVVTNLAADLFTLTNTASTLKLTNQTTSPLNVTTVTFPGLDAISGITINRAMGTPASDAVVLTGGALNVLQPITAMTSGDVLLDRSGPVTLSAEVELIGGSASRKLVLRAAGASQTAAGTITAPTLVLAGTASAAAPIDLNAANIVSTVAGSVVASSGGYVRLATAGDLVVGTSSAFGSPATGLFVTPGVLGLSGLGLTLRPAGGLSVSAQLGTGSLDAVLSAGGNVALDAPVSASTLTLSAPSVSQTAPLSVNRLAVLGGVGTYALTHTSNAVGTVVADVSVTPSGSLTLNTAGPLTVGAFSVPAGVGSSVEVSGVRVTGSAAGSVAFSSSASADLVIAAPIVADGDVVLDRASGSVVGTDDALSYIETPGQVSVRAGGMQMFPAGISAATFALLGTDPAGSYLANLSGPSLDTPVRVSAQVVGDGGTALVGLVEMPSFSRPQGPSVSADPDPSPTFIVSTAVAFGSTITGVTVSGNTVVGGLLTAVEQSVSATGSVVLLGFGGMTIDADVTAGNAIGVLGVGGRFIQNAGRLSAPGLAIRMEPVVPLPATVEFGQSNNAVGVVAAELPTVGSSLSFRNAANLTLTVGTVDLSLPIGGVGSGGADPAPDAPLSGILVAGQTDLDALKLTTGPLTVSAPVIVGRELSAIPRSGARWPAPADPVAGGNAIFDAAGDVNLNDEVIVEQQLSIRAANVYAPAAVTAQTLALLGTSADSKLWFTATNNLVAELAASVPGDGTGASLALFNERSEVGGPSLTVTSATAFGTVLSGIALGGASNSFTPGLAVWLTSDTLFIDQPISAKGRIRLTGLELALDADITTPSSLMLDLFSIGSGAQIDVSQSAVAKLDVGGLAVRADGTAVVIGLDSPENLVGTFAADLSTHSSKSKEVWLAPGHGDVDFTLTVNPSRTLTIGSVAIDSGGTFVTGHTVDAVEGGFSLIRAGTLAVNTAVSVVGGDEAHALFDLTGAFNAAASVHSSDLLVIRAASASQTAGGLSAADFALLSAAGTSGVFALSDPASLNAVGGFAAAVAVPSGGALTFHTLSADLTVATVDLTGILPFDLTVAGVTVTGASSGSPAFLTTGLDLTVAAPVALGSGLGVFDRAGVLTLDAHVSAGKLDVRAAGVSQSATGTLGVGVLAMLGTAGESNAYSFDAANAVGTFVADVTVNATGGLSIHTPLSDLVIGQATAFGRDVSGVTVSGTASDQLAFRSTGRRLSVNRTVTADAGDVVLDHTGPVSTSLLLDTGISAPTGLVAIRSTGVLLFNLDVDRLALVGTDPDGSYSVFNSSINTLAASFTLGGTGDLFVGTDIDPDNLRSMTVGSVDVPYLSLTLDGISAGGARGAFPTVLLAGYQLTVDAPVSSDGDISFVVPSSLTLNASVITPGTLDLSQFLASATYTQTAGSLDVGTLVLYGDTDFDENPQSVTATLTSPTNNIRVLAVDYLGRSTVSIANAGSASASIDTVISLGNTVSGVMLRSGGSFTFTGGTLSVVSPVAVSASADDASSLVAFDVSNLTLAEDVSVGGLLRVAVHTGEQTAGRIDAKSLRFTVTGIDVLGGSLLLDQPGNIVPLVAGRAVNGSFSLTTTSASAGATVISTVDGVTGVAADEAGFTPKFLRFIGPDLTVETILNAGFNALVLDRTGAVNALAFPTSGLQVTSFTQTSIRASSVDLPSVFAQNLTLLSAPGTSGDFRLGSAGTASNIPAFVADLSLSEAGALTLTTPDFPTTVLSSLTSPFGTHSGAALTGATPGNVAFSHTGAGFTVESGATVSLPASTDLLLDQTGPIFNAGSILAPGGQVTARVSIDSFTVLPNRKPFAPIAFATTPGSTLVTDRLLLLGNGAFLLNNAFGVVPGRPGTADVPESTTNSVSHLAADITDGLLLLLSDTPVSTAALTSPLGAASGVTLSAKAPVLRDLSFVPPSVPVFTLTSPGFTVTPGHPVTVLNTEGDGVVSLDQSGPISLLAPVSTGTLTVRGTFASFTQSAAGVISAVELGVLRTGPGSANVNLSTATNNVSIVGATVTGNFRLRTGSDLTVAAFAPRFSLDQSLSFTGVNVSPTGLVNLDAGGRLDVLADVLGSNTALGSRGAGVFGPATGPSITIAGDAVSLAALRQSADPAQRGRVTQLQNVVFRGPALGATSPFDFRIRQAFQIENLPLVFGNAQLAANFFLLESTQGFVNVGANTTVLRSNLTLIGSQGVIISAPMLLNSLSVPSGAFVRFDAFPGALPSVTTTAFRNDTPLAGSQAYGVPALLNRAATTLVAANNITFSGTIDSQGGPRALTVAALQTATFNGPVGLSSPLLSLTSTAPALTLVNADVTTTTFQTFGRTTVSGTRTLTTGSTATFLAFLDDASASPSGLTVAGNASFTTLDLASLTVTGNASGTSAFTDNNFLVNGTAAFTGVTSRAGSISAGLALITTANAALDINAGNAAIGTATAGRDIVVGFGGAIQHIVSARDVSFGFMPTPPPFIPNPSITPIADAFIGRIDSAASLFAVNNLTLGPANVAGRSTVGKDLTLIGSLSSGTVYVFGDTTGTAHNITSTGSQTYLGNLTVASVTANGSVSVGKNATLLSLTTTGTGPVDVGTNLSVGALDVSGTLLVGNDLKLGSGRVTGDVTVGRDATGTNLASGGNVAVVGTATFSGLTASNSFSADLALIDRLAAASVNAGAVIIGTATITGDVVVARSGSIQSLTADDVSFGTNAFIGSGSLTGSLSVGNDLTFNTLSVSEQVAVGRDATGTLLLAGSGVSVARTATITDVTAVGAFTAGTTVVSGTLAAASVATGTADIGTAAVTGDITVTANAAIDHVASALDLTVGGNLTSTLITSARDVRVTGNALVGTIASARDVSAGGNLVSGLISAARDLSAGTDALLGTVVSARSIVTGRDLTLTSGTFSGSASVGRDLTADFLSVAGATTVTGLADVELLTGGSLTAGTADITSASLTLDVSVTGLARFGTLSARNAAFGASATLGTLTLTGDLSVARHLLLGTGSVAGTATVLGNANAVNLTSGPLTVGSGTADGTLTVTGVLAAASLTANAAELNTATVTNDARVFGPITAESFTTALGSLHAGSADITTASIALDLTLDTSATFTTLTVGRNLTTGLDLTALNASVAGPASVGRNLLIGGLYTGSSLAVANNASIASLTLSSDLTVSGLTSITLVNSARDLTLTGLASIDTLTLARNLDAGASLLLGTATLTGVVTVASNAVAGSLTAGAVSVGQDLTVDVLAVTDALFVGRDLKATAATVGSDATIGRDLSAVTFGAGGAVQVGNTAAVSGTLTAASLTANAADLGTLTLTGDAAITLDALVRRITSADEVTVGRDALLGPVAGVRSLSTGRNLTAIADIALTGGDLTVGGDASLRNVSAVNNLAVVGNLLLVNGSFTRSGTGTFSVGGTSAFGDNDTALTFDTIIFSGPASFGTGTATLSAPTGITFKSALTTAGTAFDLTSVSGPITFEAPVTATGAVAWNLNGGSVSFLNPATFAAGTVQITGKTGITFAPTATLRGNGTSFSLLLTDAGTVRIDGDVFAARSNAGTGGDFSIVIPAPDRDITTADNVSARILLGAARNQSIEVGGNLTFDFPAAPGQAPVTPFSPTIVVSPDVNDPAAPLPTVSISAANIDSASFHRLVALGNLSLTARDDTPGGLNNLITLSDITVRGQLTLSADQTRILRRQRGPVVVPAPVAGDPLATALDTVSDTGSAVIAARYSITRGSVVSLDRDGLTDTGGRLPVAAPASQAETVPSGNSLIGYALSAETLELNTAAKLQVLRLDQLRLGGGGGTALYFDLPLKGDPLDFGNLASEFVELLPGVNTPDALPAGSGNPNGFTADQIRRLEIALGLRLGGGAAGGLTPDQLADALTNGYRIFGSDLLVNPVPATDTQLGQLGGPVYAVNAEQAVVLLTFLDELLPPSPDSPAAPAADASASTDALASALSAYLSSLPQGTAPDGAGFLTHTLTAGTPEQTAALTSLRRMLAGIDLLGLPDTAAADARSNFLRLLTDRLPETSHPGLTKDQVLQLLLSMPSSPDTQVSAPAGSARAALK